MTEPKPALIPGLAGIPAAESAVSYIDGKAGVLEYRGIPIQELTQHSTFEESAFLVLEGRLPGADELAAFEAQLASARALPERLLQIVHALPTSTHPMAALQALMPLLGACIEEPEDARASCLRLIGATGSLVAAFDRHRRDLPYVEPDPELSHAANFLWMLTGEKPAEVATRTLDVALILHIDHTMNASTFTARVVASTEADPYALCSAGVASLSGPLHGGANERVLEALEEIGDASKVKQWFAQKRATKAKVMGFGHRVYSVKDPRSLCIQGLVRQVFEELGSTPIYDIALALEAEVLEHLGAKGIHPNVDFFSGIVYQKLGIATDNFTPVFAVARVVGWLAHWMEQMQDNRIFRPGQSYVGAREASYTPMSER